MMLLLWNRNFNVISILYSFVLWNNQVNAQTKIVGLVDDLRTEAPSWLESGIKNVGGGAALDVIKISIEDEPGAQSQFCQMLSSGISMIFDVTAGGWLYGKDIATKFGIPYVHLQISINQWMAAADQLLQSVNATDAALIFADDVLLDEGLYYLVEGSVVRVIVLSGIKDDTTETLKKMRPAPAYYVIFGPGDKINTIYDKVVDTKLVTRDSRWTLVNNIPNSEKFRQSKVPDQTYVTYMTTSPNLCCTAQELTTLCGKACPLSIPESIIEISLEKSIASLPSSSIISGICANPPTARDSKPFYDSLMASIDSWTGVTWNEEKMQILPSVELNIQAINASSIVDIGSWSSDEQLTISSSFKNEPIRRSFRVGSILSRPWLIQEEDDYIGYCRELADKLANKMQFDYQFIFPADGKYGAKEKNGSWNGLVGDLARGETDIIIAPLTMTSEREEVIDFVAPYFDQSGISIVIRKRVKKENLFKFMSVLRLEVWLSIIAALIVTGVMIWLLDKFSPYSAQNSKMYSDDCRKFTLKESFWFALTSFTPQGGGEAPKALSGRTLVAAYWLFVVLMLATFTANLAAFLTVERMQTPVSSLEELAGQSKINYTVLGDSSINSYFTNMAGAEDRLYNVWKELTLNSTSDQSKYRVWDYPIKEQYTHILQVIEKTGTVGTATEAFKKVLDNEEGEFAFIHDASEIKYEVYQSCFLTEIGEPFAEQPYAIAVQQGSHLQDEISRAILELQKDRYFEGLSAKFWNSSAKGDCPKDDESEGITLESLGGVFIATLIGLALALIALAIEVIYTKKVPKSRNVTKVSSAKITPEKSAYGKDDISRIDVTPVFG